jgi:adenylylsulfate kinase-like enzyme
MDKSELKLIDNSNPLPVVKTQLKRTSTFTDDNLLHLHGTKSKLLVVMVGLPGHGKTYVAKRICRYLNWLGYRSKLFDISNYRRKFCGSDRDHSLFDPNNYKATESRLRCAKAAVEDCF